MAAASSLISLALLALALLFSLTSANLDDHPDAIGYIPNLPFRPKFRMFSGYLSVSGADSDKGKRLHYWFLESQNDPKTDPVVLWLNGGPGCSSMLGLLYEHGPFVFPDESTDLAENAYSWNTVANMLYIESPAGVGYSYSDDPAKDYLHNDTTSALDNYGAVSHFFKKFPQFLKNEFFVSGESYGGIYVPSLAYQIHVHNAKVAEEAKINLKGFLVGNGVADWNVDGSALIDFAWYHSMYSAATRAELEKSCGADKANSKECNEAVEKMRAEMGSVNIYDIYRKCYNESEISAPTDPTDGLVKILPFRPPHHKKHPTGAYHPITLPWLQGEISIPMTADHLNTLDDQLRAEAPAANASANTTVTKSKNLTPPCAEAKGALMFMNNDMVRKALNIPSSIEEWTMCNAEINRSYKIDFQRGSIWVYPQLLGLYRIFVYSGDTDAAVPITGTERWVRALNLPVVDKWRTWTVNDQLAGYVTEYQGLTFASVKGTGHMVPQWKRAEALHLFKAFLNGKKL